jgi:hypothetical protein
VLENLEVGVSYECNLLIYKKSFHGFLQFGFPRKIMVSHVFVVICDALFSFCKEKEDPCINNSCHPYISKC